MNGKKHGTCSGKTPAEYLVLSKKLKDAIAIPAAYNRPNKPVRTTITNFKNSFVSANNKITADGVAPLSMVREGFYKKSSFVIPKTVNLVFVVPRF